MIETGDILSFAASTKNAATFFRKMKFDKEKVSSITIIGGSKLGIYLAQQVLETGMKVKVIDNDRKRCEELLNLIPEAEIICGDGTDTDLLEEEDVLESSAVVAATEDDSTNTMIALYVSRQAPECKVVIKIKKSDFEDLISNLNIGSIFNPKHIAVEHIVRYVRAMQDSLGNEVESSCQVIDNKVGILEFNITEGMPHLGEPLSKIRFRKNLLIASIYRDGKTFIPAGADTMEVGDIVIVATTNDGISRFTEIFA
ncbi:MAG: NAD-binding protein [Lachnospiraceae bacterium]